MGVEGRRESCCGFSFDGGCDINGVVKEERKMAGEYSGSDWRVAKQFQKMGDAKVALGGGANGGEGLSEDGRADHEAVQRVLEMDYLDDAGRETMRLMTRATASATSASEIVIIGSDKPGDETVEPDDKDGKEQRIARLFSGGADVPAGRVTKIAGCSMDEAVGIARRYGYECVRTSGSGKTRVFRKMPSGEQEMATVEKLEQGGEETDNGWIRAGADGHSVVFARNAKTGEVLAGFAGYDYGGFDRYWKRMMALDPEQRGEIEFMYVSGGKEVTMDALFDDTGGRIAKTIYGKGGKDRGNAERGEEEGDDETVSREKMSPDELVGIVEDRLYEFSRNKVYHGRDQMRGKIYELEGEVAELREMARSGKIRGDAVDYWANLVEEVKFQFGF